MDIELNKIAGAGLGALLFTMAIGIVSDVIYAPAAVGKAGYDLPAAAEAPAGGAEKAAPAVPLPLLLAKADPKKGKRPRNPAPRAIPSKKAARRRSVRRSTASSAGRKPRSRASPIRTPSSRRAGTGPSRTSITSSRTRRDLPQARKWLSPAKRTRRRKPTSSPICGACRTIRSRCPRLMPRRSKNQTRPATKNSIGPLAVSARKRDIVALEA